MVAHHLLLPHTATRRDLDDPATITRVVDTLAATDGARKVEGGPGLLLDLLEALAEADSLATGPGVWSPWKQSLLAELGRRCRAALAGERIGRVPSEPVAPDVGGGGRRRWPPAGPVQRAQPGHGARRRRGPPGRALGRRGGARPALAGGARGRAGDRRERDGAGRPVAVLRFTVSPRFGGLPDAALLRAELGRVLDGTLALGEALARKERDYAPALPPGEAAAPARVLWFDDEVTGGVVLELRATDRIGMLHRVAAALEECDAQVRWARVATLGSSVVDSFGLLCRRRGGADRAAAEGDRVGGARGGGSRVIRVGGRRGCVADPTTRGRGSHRGRNEPGVPDVDRV